MSLSDSLKDNNCQDQRSFSDDLLEGSLDNAQSEIAEAHTMIQRTSNNNLSSETDTDDEYDLSDDEELNELLSTSNEQSSHIIHYTSTLSDHAKYLSNALAHALDSVELDKSLALQAQLSGQLNNENLKIMEKRKEVVSKLKNLQRLYNENFTVQYDKASRTSISRVDKIKNDITEIENRIEVLKSGSKNGYALGIFKPSTEKHIGIAKKYPIEYNQAKDKVLERQIEGD